MLDLARPSVDWVIKIERALSKDRRQLKIRLVLMRITAGCVGIAEHVDSTRVDSIQCNPPLKPVSYTHLTLPTKLSV